MKEFLKKAREQAKGSGDVNVANVGEGAQVDQLAVGRNILQAKINIGSLVIPVRFLLALLAVIAVIAVAVWWIVVPGKMPPGPTNVAIVQFGMQDAAGKVSGSAQGAYLSTWLYNSLTSEITDLPEKDRPALWDIAQGFDPIHLFQKRTISAPILTDADAERVADQFGARILIYGNLTPGQSVEAFAPKIFVKQSAGEADELGGSQQLGTPIPMPPDANDAYLAEHLQPIGRALVWFSRGLQYDLNGRRDEAYRILKQGEVNLPDWNEAQGKEVLYYFIGREALFLANCEQDARLVFTPEGTASGVETALNEAETNFNRAQRIAKANSRTYARATFGLGQVKLQRAQRALIPPGSSTVGQCLISAPPPGTPLMCPIRAVAPLDPTAIETARSLSNDALTLFSQAKRELPNPAPSRLDAKIQGAYASALILLGQAQVLQNNRPPAAAGFEQATTTLEQLASSVPKDDRRTLGNVYLTLGIANLANANTKVAQNDRAGAKLLLQNAVDAFNACTNFIPSDDPDTYLRTIVLPNCTCTRNDTQKALDGLK